MEARINEEYQPQRRPVADRECSLLEEWLPLVRKLVAVFSFLFLLSDLQGVYIAPLKLHMDTPGLVVVFLVVHMVAVWLQNEDEVCRGWGYELLAMALPMETCLFLLFLQYHFEAGMVIALFWLFFAILFCLLRTGTLMNMTLITPSAFDNFFTDVRCRYRCKSLHMVLYRRVMVHLTAFLLLMPALMVLLVYHKDVPLPTSKKSAVLTDGNNLMKNYDTIKLFERETWQMLTEQEKVDAMQVIADIETNYLGIAPVRVVACPLQQNTLGSYSHEKRQVLVDLSQLSDQSTAGIISVILHECRHAYQHDCVDHVNWNDPAVQTLAYYEPLHQWRSELINYTSGAADYDAYYNQSVEADAREYARRGYAAYDEYLYYPYPTR